jgi:hypothetical protein
MLRRNKILLFFTLSSIFFAVGKAQNLVPNPSFEDTIHCPTNLNQVPNSNYWSNPTLASPDFFNACSTVGGNVVHVPNNGFGFQSAHSGNAYVGCYTYNPSGREYVQTKLLDSLVSGKKYIVSLYVSLADNAGYSMNTIGIYFSKTPIGSSNTSRLPYTAQIQNTSSNPLTDKNNWMLISDTLWASGGEQYITIGNFMVDSSSDTVRLVGGFTASYYYIDDVSVIDVNSIGIKSYSENNTSVNVYPNPADDLLTIECKVENAELRILDLMGNEIKKQKIKDKKEEVDISEMASGVYFLNIKTIEGLLTKKIIIQH